MVWVLFNPISNRRMEYSPRFVLFSLHWFQKIWHWLYSRGNDGSYGLYFPSAWFKFSFLLNTQEKTLAFTCVCIAVFRKAISMSSGKATSWILHIAHVKGLEVWESYRENTRYTTGRLREGRWRFGLLASPGVSLMIQRLPANTEPHRGSGTESNRETRGSDRSSGEPGRVNERSK